jgi:Tol biopolymer transport system component
LSPDGESQAIIVDERLSLQHGDSDPRAVDVEGTVGQLLWSPHGARLAFTTSHETRRHWWIVEADGSGLVELETTGIATADEASWSPDESRLALEGRSGLNTDEAATYVATVGEDPSVIVAGTYPLPPGSDGPIEPALRWSLDGQRIVTRTWDGPVAIDAAGVATPEVIMREDVEPEFGREPADRYGFFLSPTEAATYAYLTNGDARGVYRVSLRDGAVDRYPGALHLLRGPVARDEFVPLDVAVGSDQRVAIRAGSQLVVTGPTFDPYGVIPLEVSQSSALTEMRWSPTLDRITFEADDQFFLASIGDQAVRVVGTINDGHHAIWSADGGRVALVCEQESQRATIIDAETGEREGVNDFASTHSSDFIWPPELVDDGLDDVWAAPVEKSGPYDIFTGPSYDGRINLTNSPDVVETDPSWSPDRESIAYSRSNELWLMDADGSNQRRLAVLGSAGTSQPLQWSPDGRFIAWNRFGELAIVDAQTGAVVHPVATGCYPYFVEWTDDSESFFVRTQCSFDGL